MKKSLINILATLLLVGGAGILCYPGISQRLAQKNQTRLIQQYQQTVELLDHQTIVEAFEKAQAYNQKTAAENTHLQDPFSTVPPNTEDTVGDGYLSLLLANGMMGYMEIPSIGIYLPIYHTTQDTVLKKGVGHLPQSSLPTGIPGNHAVFTAHRGLPTARLFTDLNLLNTGDIIHIHIYNYKMTYAVDQILVVEPDDVQALYPIADEDMITLVTCTPLSINSHRLLVRGIRTPETLPESKPPQYKTAKNPWIIYTPIAAAALFPAVWFIRKKRIKKQGR